MITVDLVDSSFPFSNSCALRVKSCWEGFSPPSAPQRHMMLVGGDPLPGQNGSGPCSPSILVTALTHPLPYFSLNMSPSIFFKKKSSKTDCWLCCLLFSVGTSFLVVTGWNEFCGRFEIFGGWIITQGTGWVSGEAEASSAKARWWKVFSLLLKCKFDLYKWTCALFLLEHSVS